MSDRALSQKEFEREQAYAEMVWKNDPEISHEELAAARENMAHNYVFDFRLMDESDLKVLEEKMRPGDSLRYDPLAPRYEEFLHNTGIIIGGIRYDGDDGRGPRELEPGYEEMQQAKADAYREETKMINALLANEEYLKKRVQYLERANGMKVVLRT